MENSDNSILNTDIKDKILENCNQFYSVVFFLSFNVFWRDYFSEGQDVLMV